MTNGGSDVRLVMCCTQRVRVKQHVYVYLNLGTFVHILIVLDSEKLY